VRVDVALLPAALAPAALSTATVLVVDVLRASTTIVTALTNGCLGIVPLDDPDEARRRAANQPGSLIAGERRGEPLEGFDLGNSPLEFTRDRVGGRMLFLTTSNGTKALRAARPAQAIGVAGFVNLGAAAEWALAQGRDLVVLCSGERGNRSLEDEVCAGFLVERLLATSPEVQTGREATEVARRAQSYGKDLTRLAQDSRWARHLASRGRAGDVAVCLALDASELVPIYRPDVDKIVSPFG
jgi:2-phosphosulfolactate phosphatase